LQGALDGLSVYQAREVLEGFETLDDAGIFQISSELALVQTLDFFTPILDDPYAFGQIAAANSLSDVYAMGGRPVTAMNILAVPMSEVGADRLRQILQGGADKLREAECSLVGGHTVQDQELKYGCSITGLVHPKEFWSNAAARPGDVLVLTKPLGTGILTSAHKAGKLPTDELKRVMDVMSSLNRAASEAARRIGGISSATDITGFGLAGHAGSMARASKVTIAIRTAAVPCFPSALHFARKKIKTQGDRTNRDYMAGHYQTDRTVSREIEDVMFDPQTSGGLLLAVSPDKAESLVAELKRVGSPSAGIVGKVLPQEKDLYVRMD
jgi:selenide,water dikinase